MSEKLGYQGVVPSSGAFFDRVDVEGEMHSRTYFSDGARIVSAVLAPDQERPGKWQLGVQWRRRGALLSHGWGPLASEEVGMLAMDAIGIGVEAALGGAVCLAHLSEQAPNASSAQEEASNVGRVGAYLACIDMQVRKGQRLTSASWNDLRTVKGLCPDMGVHLSSDSASYWARTLPGDVRVVR